MKLTKTQKNFIKQMKKLDENYTGPVQEERTSSIPILLAIFTIIAGIYLYNAGILNQIIPIGPNVKPPSPISTNDASPSIPNSVNQPSQPSQPIIQPSAPIKPNLEVVSHKIETDQHSSKYVVGIIKNNSAQEYKYVFVHINLFDKSGIQIGNTSDMTLNLEPGSSWRFRADIFEKETKTYKIKKITYQ